MKHAKDFRQIARDALRGKWLIAVLTGFVASLLGAGIATSGSSGGSVSSGTSSSEELIQSLSSSEFVAQISGVLVVIGLILTIWAIALLIISGAARMGYAIFNLKLVDGEEVAFSDLFSQFNRLGSGFCMNFLVNLFTILWSLLLVIPGIIKTFSYAMTPYILAENPGMRARDAITQSRRVMNGNKWRLFCLGLSFIGWSLLCAAPVLISILLVTANSIASDSISGLWALIPGSLLTFVGYLFLAPYTEAAYAAFYRDICPVPVLDEE